MSTKSLPELTKCAISDPRERRAVALLHEAGWSIGELSMTFQCSDRPIRKIIDEKVGDP